MAIFPRELLDPHYVCKFWPAILWRFQLRRCDLLPSFDAMRFEGFEGEGFAERWQERRVAFPVGQVAP